MVYRVKQFIWHLTSKWQSIDNELINKYLSKKEIEVFNKLNVSEQQHSIRVCNDALNKVNNEDIKINKNKLAKVALLHDIGKIIKTLNIIDKSIIVILDKITNGNLKKHTNLKKIDVYYNHPKNGVKILKNINKYDNEFLEAISKHHKKDTKLENNMYLKIIRECDDRN